MTVPLLFVASLWLTYKPLWLLLALVGRTGACPLSVALDTQSQVERQNRLTEQIIRDSRSEPVDTLGLIRWTTPRGVFWAPQATRVHFLLGEQAEQVYGAGARRVQPGDIVLDCGANIGTFTREALDAGAAKVVAIEPSPRNIEALRRTFATEVAAGRVVVYPKGVWDRQEILTFWAYENSALDSAVMPDRKETDKPIAVHVPVETIDSIAAELGLGKIHFIKMDIEGAERRALDGARRVITRDHPRMAIATENLPDDQYVVPTLVKAMWNGYRQECHHCSVIGPFEIRPDIMLFF